MKKRLDILLILPSIFGISVFFVIPFGGVIYYAFTENTFTRKFVGISNFKAVINNEFFQLAIKNTLLFTITAVSITMILSIIIAFLLGRIITKFAFLQKAFFLPVILPSAVIVVLWQAYFNDYSPFSSLILIFIWKYIGLNIMLILSALSCIDKAMLDAARIDGAGNLRLMWFVTLPNITPTLFFSLILTIVNSFKIYRESYLLWGAYPDKSAYMLQNYMDNHFIKLNYQNISTAAIIFVVCIYTIVAIFYIAEKRWSDRIL